MITLGFDPGGDRKFGCAVLDVNVDGNPASLVREVASLRSVDEAEDWAVGIVGCERPAGIGIDTLLSWQSTRCGWRGADEWLRRTYPDTAGSVVSSNGLYGSMSVQGALLAARLRARWPDTVITETHPKVLWHHFKRSYPRNWDLDHQQALTELDSMGCEAADKVGNDHEFDAVLSAWAVSQALSQGWDLNLFDVEAEEQQVEYYTLCSDVQYLWPPARAAES